MSYYFGFLASNLVFAAAALIPFAVIMQLRRRKMRERFIIPRGRMFLRIADMLYRSSHHTTCGESLCQSVLGTPHLSISSIV